MSRRRWWPSLLLRRRRSVASDSGFTLVELLVVLVILPLLVGAVAEVVIVSVRNDSTVEARISDSMNAQLTSAYFVRDVQGATQISTDPSVFSSGRACGPSVNPGTPLVAMLGPGLNVGYWLQGVGGTASVTRYSCNGASTVTTTVADVPAHLAAASLSATTSITPTQIADAAANGWALTAASTQVASVQTIGATLNVDSTTGFSVGSTPSGTVCTSTAGHPTYTALDGCSGGSVNVETAVGSVQITCSGVSATSLTLCTGGSGAAVGNVTQSLVSAVQIAVDDMTGGYHYNLVASPRSSANACTTVGGCSQGKGPTLLALGSGGITFKGNGSASCTDGRTAHLCVTGNVLADGGTIDCGTGSIDASTGVSAVNSSTSSCGSVPINPSDGEGDYVAASLPLCFFSSFMSNQGVGTPQTATSGLLTPGVYTNPLSGATLEPGVYVLEGGVTGSLSMASPDGSRWWQNPPGTGPVDPNAGVLLYIPGPPIPGEPSGCLDSATSPAVNLGSGNSTVSLTPLEAQQSAFWFSNSSALTNFWIWQSRSNSSSLSMGGTERIVIGTPPSTSTPSGMTYLPRATLVTSDGTPKIYTGCLVLGGVYLKGTPGITLSGNC